MDDATLQANRRDFLGLAATAAVAGIGALVPATDALAANGTSTDFTRWLDSIPGTYKQLYDMPEVNGGMGLVWSFAFFMTGAPAYGVPQSDLGAVLVLRHNALPLALNDSAWAKYKLGDMFKINDPDTGAPAVRNAFYRNPNALQVPHPNRPRRSYASRIVEIGQR